MTGEQALAPAAVSPDRRAELAERLAAVERRLAAACEAAGRRRDEVTLIAVTKTFPVEDVAALAGLGVREVGENRDQEARAKVAALRAARGPQPRWHFIGRLQRNKCRSVASYAHAVHSVDRMPLVEALDAAAQRSGRVVAALVQVDLDPADGRTAAGQTGRGGAAPAEVPALADAIRSTGNLRLAGVMAVAPLRGDPDRAFARLHEVSAELRRRHPEAGWISAGMSGDLEAAIRHGATHVRLGTALLGGRPPPLR